MSTSVAPVPELLRQLPYAATICKLDFADVATVDLPATVVTPFGRLELHPDRAEAGAERRIAPADLHLSGLLGARVRVTVEFSPWSPGRSELGVRPPARRPVWLPTARYIRAANALAVALARHLDHAAAALDAA